MLFVFITKSFLTYHFSTYTCFINHIQAFVKLHVSNHPTDSSSYSYMRGPGIGCWFSDRSNCSCRSFEAAVLPINPNIDTDQWEPFIIYQFIILQTHYQFKLDFQKVDLHTGGTWLIHGTRNRKDNQLQSMELPCRISWWNRNLQNWFLRNILHLSIISCHWRKQFK